MGYSFRADSLLSIGSLLYMYDFRFGVSVDSTLRVLRWNDLGPNGFHLNPYFGTTNTKRDASDDTIILDSAAAVLDGFKFESQNEVRTTNLLNCMHDGTPWMGFAVLRTLVTGGSTTELFLLNTGGSGSKGARWYTQSNNTLRYTIWTPAGQQVNGTTAGSIPNTDTDTLITIRYYGRSVGSGDIKMTIGNNTYSFNTTGTLESGTWTGGGIVSRLNAPSGDRRYNMKLNGAYTMAGKSVVEIDAFFSFFLTLLKQDPEYSSLATP